MRFLLLVIVSVCFVHAYAQYNDSDGEVLVDMEEYSADTAKAEKADADVERMTNEAIQAKKSEDERLHKAKIASTKEIKVDGKNDSKVTVEKKESSVELKKQNSDVTAKAKKTKLSKKKTKQKI